MRRYWLVDQLGVSGPTVLVETDGSLHIVDVIRFGPTVTEVEQQQKIWDEVIGRVAPTLKPFVPAASVDEEGIAPHADLWRGEGGSGGGRSRAARRGGRAQTSTGQPGGGPSRRRSRGDR